MRALNQDEQDQRKRKVLHSVIHEYVRTGKPVGSHTVVDTGRLDLSSATIRNILSDLEQEELIMHPHTSAGRVPTDKGYRSYVDSLIELQRLAIREQTRIQREYETRIKEIEGLMSQTSKMLSSISHYTGFVMTPKLEKNIFSHMELVPISGHRILVAMITQSGLTRHFIVNTQMVLPRERLRSISRIINQSFQGQTLKEVQLRMMERLDTVMQEYRDMITLAKEIGLEIKKFSTSAIYLDGTSNILSLPDFTKADDQQDIFKIIEEKQILMNLLEKDLLQESDESFSDRPHPNERKDSRRKKGKFDQQTAKSPHSSHVHIRIGSENTIKAMQNLSLVSSTYQLADKTVGVLGILGPKRMEYPKMIALVDYISHMMNRVLKEFEKR